MSGAGRSTALHVLEDLGFFCVDNLPPSLSSSLVSLVGSDREISRLGLGIDVRTGTFLQGLEQEIDALSASGHEVEILFVDCGEESLLRRFKETRRPHPLANGGDVTAAILAERERLGPLRARADHIFDTTEMNVHDLRTALIDHIARGGTGRKMVTRVVSFGFKFGIPLDADLVFDLRYLPNPHFVPELKAQTGTHPEVAKFVLESEAADALLARLLPLLKDTVPRHEREGKAYLTIAVGCTGGRHRSVAIAEELVKQLRADREVYVVHRDVKRLAPSR